MAWLFAADLVPNNLSFIHSADETAVPGGEAEGGERARCDKRLKKINKKDHFHTGIH